MSIRRSALAVAVLLILPTYARAERLGGYLEYREGAALIVEGQRIQTDARTRFRGEGDARSAVTIPLGYEVKVEGSRQADGSILATKVEAKPNGEAMFEGDLRSAFDEAEAGYRKAGRMLEHGADGEPVDLGRLLEAGPEVERVEYITARLVPPYLPASEFRVYVVDNDEWNAMAAPNRSIYVFSGLLRDMDDDEVAIVLGHELAHSTHEHSRRQFKSQIWVQLAALGALTATEAAVDGDKTRAGLQLATMVGMSALQNGYGRGHEDQADRVGLRYAYEAGYDVRKGPGLWGRFEEKYGGQNKAVNFFLGSHSVARDRARNLTEELGWNYHEVRPASDRLFADRGGSRADPRQRSPSPAADDEDAWARHNREHYEREASAPRRADPRTAVQTVDAPSWLHPGGWRH